MLCQYDFAKSQTVVKEQRVPEVEKLYFPNQFFKQRGLFTPEAMVTNRHCTSQYSLSFPLYLAQEWSVFGEWHVFQKVLISNVKE